VWIACADALAPCLHRASNIQCIRYWLTRYRFVGQTEERLLSAAGSAVALRPRCRCIRPGSDDRRAACERQGEGSDDGSLRHSTETKAEAPN
jgi:hypothetical protein